MTERITVGMVRGMFGRAEIAARSVGLDTHGWYLMPGSRVNGQSWRLFTRPGGGDALAGLDRGFLGRTGREAYDTLHTLAVAWETVAERIRSDPNLWYDRWETLECAVCGRNDLATTHPPRCTRHRHAHVSGPDRDRSGHPYRGNGTEGCQTVLGGREGIRCGAGLHQHPESEVDPDPTGAVVRQQLLAELGEANQG